MCFHFDYILKLHPVGTMSYVLGKEEGVWQTGKE